MSSRSSIVSFESKNSHVRATRSELKNNMQKDKWTNVFDLSDRERERESQEPVNKETERE
jgi:hypothetical protein